MRIKKYLCLVLAIIMSMSIFAGCTNGQSEVNNSQNDVEEKTLEESDIKIDEDTVTFVDARGKEITYNKNPERVVCIYNSYLDLWYKCGGTVVGRVEATADKPVPGSENAEVVGTAGSPSVEKILSLKPDLVILSNFLTAHRGMVDILEQNNIKVMLLEIKYKDDYLKTVKLFTALTGREDLYEQYGKKVNEDIEKIIEKVPKDKKPKILIIYATAKNLTVRGTDSMVGEMLEDLNTINISGKIGNSTDAKVFSMEKILQEDPDFIFVQIMGSDKEKIFKRLKDDAESNPAWASLTAVKNDRYIILPKDLYLYIPNDRYAEAYEGLAKILYPEVFDK